MRMVIRNLIRFGLLALIILIPLNAQAVFDMIFHQASDDFDYVQKLDTLSDDLIPDTTCTYDIGSSSLEWKDAFFNGTMEADVIFDGTLSITDGNLTTTGTGTFSKLSFTNTTASYDDITIATSDFYNKFTYSGGLSETGYNLVAPAEKNMGFFLFGNGDTGDYTPWLYLWARYTTDAVGILSDVTIDLQSNDDISDYIRFQTLSDIPEITTVGDCDLKITSTANVNVVDDLVVGADTSGYDVKFYGTTTGVYLLWDNSADELNLTSANLTTTGTADLLGENQFGDANTENHGINTAPVANRMLTADFTNTGAISFFIDGTYAHTGDNAKSAKGYSLDLDISGTHDAGAVTSASRGIDIDLDDSTIYDNVSAGGTHYGIYTDVNFAGTNTNNSTLSYVPGYFISGGDIGTTGDTKHYGIYGTALGTADNNYGGWFNASEATNNWGVWVGSGDVALDGDDQKLCFGQAQDTYIEFDGDSLNIVANAITPSDDLIITAETLDLGSTVLTTTGSISTTDIIYTDAIESNITTGINFDDTNLTTTGTITDGVLTISDGNITGMGNITGDDVDISVGTGTYLTTGPINIDADNTKLSIGDTLADFELYSDGTYGRIDTGSGLQIDGPVGIGIAPDANRIFYLNASLDTSSTTKYASYIKSTNTGTGGATFVMPLYFIHTIYNNAGSQYSISGVKGEVNHWGDGAVSFINLVDTLYGTQASGTVGTVGTLRGVRNDIRFTGTCEGTITNIYGYNLTVDAEDGIMTTVTGMNIPAYEVDGGTLGTGYGIRLGEQTVGTTANYEMWLDGAGEIFFRDTALHIGSLADGYIDYTADIGHRFSGPVTTGIDDTGYDVKFYGATAGSYLLWDESGDDLYFVGTGSGLAFGCIEGEDETVACTDQNTYYRVTFDTVGQNNLTTVDIDNEEITVSKAGVYIINVTACFHSAVSSDFELLVQKNADPEVVVGNHLFQTTAVGDKVENTAGSCQFALDAGDIIHLWVRCTSAAGRSAVFDHVNLHLTQIGG